MKKLIPFYCVCSIFAAPYLKTNAQSMQNDIVAPKAKKNIKIALNIHPPKI